MARDVDGHGPAKCYDIPRPRRPSHGRVHLPSAPPSSIEIPPILYGKRVLVRPFSEEDTAAFWAALEESRSHLEPWLPWVQYVRSVDDARADLARLHARWLTREDLAVGIFDRETGRLFGGSGLHRINWTLRLFEIGYWIRPSAEGRGYVTEAVQLLVRLAFDRLEANRVEIRMDPENLHSRRIPERLGFVLEGTLRRSAPGRDGTPSDRHVFSLVRDDYARLPWATVAGDGRP
ncbi:MAG TPA: GNAT family N-acetyltransferase [bacterium]|nr:GNAT family N-acetyltransferase [bacterium]